MPYEYLIRLDKKYNLKAEELAPLTDAGLTPYRGIKKLRDAGALGPDRVMAVIGIGGMGVHKEIDAARKLGAAETAIYAQFLPPGETAEDLLTRTETLRTIAKSA